MHARISETTHEWIPEEAKGDRDHADVEADQREAGERSAVGLG